MNTDDSSITPHLGKVVPGIPRFRESRSRPSPIEINFSYVNRTPVPVSIGLRNGFKFTLPAEPDNQPPRLVIRVEILTTVAIKTNIQRVLSVVDDASTQELQLLRDAFQKEIEVNAHGGSRMYLDYPIEYQTLRQCGGSIYSNETDTVVSILDVLDMPEHPHSLMGKHKQLIAENLSEESFSSFGYTLKIIDNTGIFGDRFINLAGRVFKVVATEDQTMREGVYILTNGHVKSLRETPATGMEIVAFEDAEEHLGLYRTFAEAYNSADRQLERKEKIAQMEYDTQFLRAELTRAKEAFNQSEFERERIRKSMEEQAAAHAADQARQHEEYQRKMERERAQMKDDYERKSHERKDHSESLKFLPTIIVGIGAIMVAIKTLLSSSQKSFSRTGF